MHINLKICVCAVFRFIDLIKPAVTDIGNSFICPDFLFASRILVPVEISDFHFFLFDLPKFKHFAFFCLLRRSPGIYQYTDFYFAITWIETIFCLFLIQISFFAVYLSEAQCTTDDILLGFVSHWPHLLSF